MVVNDNISSLLEYYSKVAIRKINEEANKKANISINNSIDNVIITTEEVNSHIGFSLGAGSKQAMLYQFVKLQPSFIRFAKLLKPTTITEEAFNKLYEEWLLEEFNLIKEQIL